MINLAKPKINIKTGIKLDLSPKRPQINLTSEKKPQVNLASASLSSKNDSSPPPKVTTSPAKSFYDPFKKPIMPLKTKEGVKLENIGQKFLEKIIEEIMNGKLAPND